MAPFFPLYVQRSDGKTELKSAKGAKESNEPLPAQLDQTPNDKGVSDFYRQCQAGDPKEIDWRRKLAGMLMRELEGKDLNASKNYLLAALPENYRLFEHVKCKVQDGVDKVKVTKHHAAGGNERQDAYLYGHPQGRKKRYRSPAEFFPHLLWLATDEAGDPNNCSCKFCSPEELEDKQTAKPIVKEVKSEPARSTPDSVVKAPPPATLPPVALKPPAQPIAKALHPENIQSKPLPKPLTQQQANDSQYNGILYRPGEIVWFQRGSAWGLGVISKRTSHARPTAYTVQPFSYPTHHPISHTLLQEQLRPWLAWSPPPCTHRDLNPHPGNNNTVSTYNSVKWDDVVKGKYGGGDAEVDGSILAVKAAETTFTAFGQIPDKSRINLNYYNGIFIGGEKIWTGDALRMRYNANNHTGSNTDIMVLHDIVETPGKNASQTRITLVGDIYVNEYVRIPEGSVPPNPDPNLPVRVQEDLQYRNNITTQAPDPAKRLAVLWRLASKSARIGIADIKGRWYESSVLGPVLDPQGFARAKQHGEIIDTGLCMNSQGDCNRPVTGPPSGYKAAENKARTRVEAFGKAVPPNFKIDDGEVQTQRPQEQAPVNGKQELPTQTNQATVSQQPTTQMSPLPEQHDLSTQPSATQTQSQFSVPSVAGNYHEHERGYDDQYLPQFSHDEQSQHHQNMSENAFDQYMKYDDNDGDDADVAEPNFGHDYDSNQMHGFFRRQDDDHNMQH